MRISVDTLVAHRSQRSLLLALCIASLLVAVAPTSAGLALPASSPRPAAVATLGDPKELATFMDGMIGSQMAEQHVAGAVAVVVKDGQVLLAKGYGYADVEKRIPIDPETTLFRPGSVTKLFTWTAVMQLVEQSKLDLQADVNTYLTRFKIPATYSQPITMLDLMAHTSGFEDREKNLFKDSLDELTSLEDYLVQNMPARVFPPGQIPAYSNYGSALAGYIIEQVSGEPYEQYIEAHILTPLGMDHSTMEQPLPEALAPNMSLGYSFGSDFQAEEFELVQASPAGALSASGQDMGKFMLAHLQDGEYNGARILRTETAQLMHTQLNTYDPLLPGMAYGFMESLINGRRLIWHGGGTFQFHTLLALLPEEQTGIYVSYNTPPSPLFLEATLRTFMDRFFPGASVSAPNPPADFGDRTARYTGFYETSRMAYTTAEKAFASILAVQPGPNNTLRIPDPASFDMSDTWVEVQPLVMQNTRTGELAVFREDQNGTLRYAAVGNWPVSVLIKLPWYGGPPVKFGVLGFSLLASLSTVIAAIVTSLIPHRKRTAEGRSPWPGRFAHWVALLLCIAAIALIAFVIMVFMDLVDLASATGELVLAVLPWTVAFLTPIVVVLAGLAWWKRWWKLGGRLHYTVLALAALALLWFELHWSLLVV
jgi:CubicO group peptidase (beta-lactamase class C family)